MAEEGCQHQKWGVPALVGVLCLSSGRPFALSVEAAGRTHTPLLPVLCVAAEVNSVHADEETLGWRPRW